ncbi:MAG: hypothetical protein UHK60_03810 [Acutalibacteraceae bacterium]|nr:hypothetical protein [Acutalibacteraceae bacterium]
MKKLIIFMNRFKYVIAIILFLAITSIMSFSMYRTELNKNKELLSLTQTQQATEATEDKNYELISDIQKDKDKDINDEEEHSDFTEQVEIESVIKNYVEVYYIENASTSKKDRISKYKTLVTKDMYELYKEDLNVAFFSSSITDTEVTNVDVFFGKLYSEKTTAVAVIDRKITNEENKTYIEDKVYEKYELKYEDDSWVISDIII